MNLAASELLMRGDKYWHYKTLQRDVDARSLSSLQCNEIIHNCEVTAEKMKRQLIAHYGILRANEYADQLGISILPSIDQIMPGFLYMGLYEPEIRSITLNQNVIKLIKSFVIRQELETITSISQLESIIIFHELFHALEEMTPGIYTRSKLITKKYLGLFSVSKQLDSASEVGAIHFSRCMSGISFSPCIFEEFLLMAIDQQ